MDVDALQNIMRLLIEADTIAQRIHFIPKDVTVDTIQVDILSLLNYTQIAAKKAKALKQALEKDIHGY